MTEKARKIRVKADPEIYRHIKFQLTKKLGVHLPEPGGEEYVRKLLKQRLTSREPSSNKESLIEEPDTSQEMKELRERSEFKSISQNESSFELGLKEQRSSYNLMTQYL